MLRRGKIYPMLRSGKVASWPLTLLPLTGGSGASLCAEPNAWLGGGGAFQVGTAVGVFEAAACGQQ